MTEPTASRESLQIAANAVHAKLFGASRETLLFVLNLLSYEVEQGPQQRGKSSGWDGRSSLFDLNSSKFPAGFVHMVGRELIRRGHAIQYAVKGLPDPLGPAPGSVDPMGLGWAPRYDYQPETVRRLLKHGRGIARVATGGGKSRICQLTYDAIRRPTLFLTTRKSLMHQMKKSFEANGVMPGTIGDSIWQPRRTINVAMVQTLIARLADPDPKASPEKQEAQRLTRERTIAFLSYVEVVIGEEAHEVGGVGYYLIMAHCRNAHYRLALTATPFMRADEEANMRLQASFGSVLIEVTEEELINKGILATPYFSTIRTPSPPLLRRSTKWPGCYDMNIVDNELRTKLLVENIKLDRAYGLTALVLIQRPRHGKLIMEALEREGIKAMFVFGLDDQAERERAFRALQRREIDCLIGSTIVDVGVDIPAVGHVYTAGGGKAEVQARQRIGRGLREKHNGPNVAFFTDFADNGNKYTGDHSAIRRAIIEATPGFRERLLPVGVPLPYEKFFSRAETVDDRKAA